MVGSTFHIGSNKFGLQKRETSSVIDSQKIDLLRVLESDPSFDAMEPPGYKGTWSSKDGASLRGMTLVIE